MFPVNCTFIYGLEQIEKKSSQFNLKMWCDDYIKKHLKLNIRVISEEWITAKNIPSEQITSIFPLSFLLRLSINTASISFKSHVFSLYLTAFSCSISLHLPWIKTGSRKNKRRSTYLDNKLITIKYFKSPKLFNLIKKNIGQECCECYWRRGSTSHKQLKELVQKVHQHRWSVGAYHKPGHKSAGGIFTLPNCGDYLRYPHKTYYLVINPV